MLGQELDFCLPLEVSSISICLEEAAVEQIGLSLVCELIFHVFSVVLFPCVLGNLAGLAEGQMFWDTR